MAIAKHTTYLSTLLLLALLCLHAKAVDPDSATFLTPQKQYELFVALNLAEPGLEAAQNAWKKGDSQMAIHALADYYRNRTQVTWTFDPHHPKRIPGYQNPVADDAANGTVAPAGLHVPFTFKDNKIDWFYNATEHQPGISKNGEWQYQLCRMAFWKDLAAAYQATGDKKYATAWITQFHSFLEQCPMPDHYDVRAWRGLECEARMTDSWPNAFHGFLLSPAFTDEDLCLYLHQCLDHAHCLKKYAQGANAEIGRLIALYTMGTLYPEFEESKEWRTNAIKQMDGQMTFQWTPDGVHYELSPGYGTGCANSVLNMVKIARQYGRLDEFKKGYIEKMEKTYDYPLYFMTPDRMMPQFNDSWLVNARTLLTQGLEYFPDRADFQWIATDGKKGQAPAETSHSFDYAGFQVMRSGWERHANYAVFRSGPCIGWHSHQDQLAVIIHPYGRNLLFTAGGPSYEYSAWRDYAQSSYAANCITVDGLAQYRPKNGRPLTPAPDRLKSEAHWQSTPGYDYADGIYDQGYGSDNKPIATQTRRVLFIKPDLFLIVDTLAPNDTTSHSYQARWHLDTLNSKLDPATQQCVTTDPGLPNLAIIPLALSGLVSRTVSAQTEPELLGWYLSFRDKVPRRAATTLLQNKHGVGIQTFITLLAPIRVGASNPVAAVSQSQADSTLVTLTDGRRFTIHLGPGQSLRVSGKPVNSTATLEIEIGRLHHLQPHHE